MSSFAEEVTYRRAALLLGLETPETVFAWAEGAFAADPAPPLALIDAVMAPRELTALRAALAPAALEPEPVSVVRRLVGRVAEDVRAGRRSADDTVHVFAQMRRMVALPPDLARALDDHEDAYRLAAGGVEGSLGAVRAGILAWLNAQAPAEPCAPRAT